MYWRDMEARTHDRSDPVCDIRIDLKEDSVKMIVREVVRCMSATEMKHLLAAHVRICTNVSCRTCATLRERATQRRLIQDKRKHELMRLWRGVAKSIAPILALFRRSGEVARARQSILTREVALRKIDTNSQHKEQHRPQVAHTIGQKRQADSSFGRDVKRAATSSQ